MNDRKTPLLETVRLTKTFLVPNGTLQAVSDISLSLRENETLGLVGESGSGKSTLGRLLLRLEEPDSGMVRFDGRDLQQAGKKELRTIRREMQYVFQDPYSSLDPRMNVGEIVTEPLAIGRLGSKRERLQKAEELLQLVGLQPEDAGKYPHQFSGGQRQRIAIARALILHPKFVVYDEPVSALDVSVQAQILNLLADLQKQLHLTYLFISHDLSVVHYISDRVCVMFLGKICEIAETEELFRNAAHPYTRFLLASTPAPDPAQRHTEQDFLQGELPSPVDPPSGCRFRTRCPYAQSKCAEQAPPFVPVGEPGHLAACHFPLRQDPTV